MRSPRSRADFYELSSQMARRDPAVPPGPNIIGSFCPTARPVLLLVTDQHPPGHASLAHSHPCIAFHGCLHGPIVLVTNGGEQQLDAGTMYLFGPGTRHQWRNNGSSHAVMLSFLLDADHPGGWPRASGVRAACRELTERVQGALRFESRGQDFLHTAFWALADSLQLGQPQEPALVTGLLWTLIGRLAACLRSSAEGAANRFDTARQMQSFLMQRIQDRLSVADIARHVHLSPSRAKEIFRGAFGCGIMSYFNQLKIQQAKRLLGDESLTVKQVGKRLGFSSASYFDQVFFRHTGLRPTEFRRQG